jgi:IMP dehydrogenase
MKEEREENFNRTIFVRQVYEELYPDIFSCKRKMITSLCLNEIKLRPVYSEIAPDNVNLTNKIGGVNGITMPIPLFSAAMDMVSGPDMAKALSTAGGCAIIYRHKKANIQLDWLRDALDHKHCLVREPKTLSPNDRLEDASEIVTKHGFSTIPVIDEDGILLGVVFTDDIVFKGNERKFISEVMKPFRKLKVESSDTTFEIIKKRLFNEEECTILPVVDDQRKFRGIYFLKDFFYANPSFNAHLPLVGMAIGVEEEDLERAARGIEMGAGAIVIDSSHGNCPAVINITKKVAELIRDHSSTTTDVKTIIIAGNIADVDGYVRLAEAGADAVKVGIGSGSICTTTEVTGAGVGMFTALREVNCARKKLIALNKQAPALIADGGINGPGDMVIASAAGADACMAGKWLVASAESISFQQFGAPDEYVYYRGMASDAAIKDRSSNRYGRGKRAPEGVEGRVKYRGPLVKFLNKDMELVRGGFAHVGAKNMQELHRYGDNDLAFTRFTGAGQLQIATRLE